MWRVILVLVRSGQEKRPLFVYSHITCTYDEIEIIRFGFILQKYVSWYLDHLVIAYLTLAKIYISGPLMISHGRG